MAQGTIYIMQGEDTPNGPVKIGYTSRQVSLRVAEAQTYSHQTLIVLMEADGTYQSEAALHRLFEPYHKLGEWYVLGPLIQELIHYVAEGGSLKSWLDESKPR